MRSVARLSFFAMKTPRLFVGLLLAALAPLFPLAASLSAQAVSVGTIEGRVFNTRNGEYLERAHVTIEGTSLEAFTDSGGQFRISNVPAGAVKLKIFYTGQDAQTDTVTVGAGETVQHDFNFMAGKGRPGAERDGSVVKLDEFIVGVSKEMDAAAIAINEQRFAPNIINVVSADEFGAVVEGNVGDFLKYLPGITVDTGGGDMRTISMNGAPSNNVPIMVNGFSLASAQSSGTSRSIELEQTSVNNIARFEVIYTPTPESPGSALAGSINMVPRSAFERSRPQFNGTVFLMMKDNYKDWNKTPGPRVTPTHKIKPGFDFSWVVPVNKRFGFTVSGAHSNQYTSEDFSSIVWKGSGSTTTASPNTPGTGLTPTAYFAPTTPDRPYVSEYAVQDANKFSKRTSFGATVDYKVSNNDRVSFTFQWAFFDAELSNRKLSFFGNRISPGNFDTTYTHADAGMGILELNNSGMRQKSGTTYTPTFTYRHNGPLWKAELGLGHSHASNHYRDDYRGFFNNSLARRTGVTINFDDNFYLRPRRITVTDTAGRPVDPFTLSNYAIVSTSNGYQESADQQRSAYGSLRRDFYVRDIPFSLKGGTELKQSVRDIRKYSPSWNYVGDDNRQVSTPVGADASHNASIVLDDTFSDRYPPYGLPKIQWMEQEKLYELYKAHPEYFSLNTANSAYRSQIDQSKHAEELISSAYLRGDVAFFARRLRFVGGLRVEQTNVKASGPLTDPTLDFQRDANGNVVRGSNGRPLLIVPTNAGLDYSKLTYIDRGYHADKEYLRYFPSVNGSYNVRENLVAHAGWYTSIGRPNFDQYVGGLTLPDTDAVPSGSNRISVNNAGIKPWSARTTKVRLEYYPQGVAKFAIGAFRRDYKNFFGSLTTDATPAFLALYNLDPDLYEPYQVQTNYNLSSKVRMTGVDADYKQALTFLPNWARGVQVFANASAQRATGDATNNFSYVPRTYNWGISLSRQKYNLKFNWNYRSPVRQGAQTGTGLEPGIYEWSSKKMLRDIYADYMLTRHLGLFMSLRNVGSAPEDVKRYGPHTPEIARFRQRQDYGSAWVFGVKGTF